ncbi:MAG: TolC family protein [Elusimicrobiota bacterium]
MAGAPLILALLGFSPAFCEVPSLSLDGAAVIAEENNVELRAAREVVAAAEAEYRGALSNLLPKLSLSLNHTRAESRLSHVLSQTENSTLGLTGSVPLFAGGANAANLRRKGLELRRARAQGKVAEAAVLFELRQAYARLLYAQEAVLLSDEVVRRREENLQLIRQKYEAGRESKAALLEVESLLTASQWERAKDEHGLRTAQTKLDQVLEWPLTREVRAEAVSPLPVPSPDMPDWQAEFESHPSLLADRCSIEIGRESLASARSGFFPTADLDTSYNKVGSSKWGLQDRNWSWSVGLRLPFFSGGRTRADTLAAQAELRRLQVEKSGAKDGLWVEAQDSLFAWREAAKWMDVADVSLKASEARAWLVQNQYSTGQATYFEWRNVEEQLVSVKRQALAAKRDLIIARARFDKAMGRGVR